jgi:hypothetical protein
MTKEMENRHEILNLKTDELKGQSHWRNLQSVR